jgi:RNA polymerase sigma-70 factor (ECF subfamily)
VVLLRVLGGFTAQEVGVIVGKSPGAVRVLQHRGLRRLASELERTTADHESRPSRSRAEP